MPIVAKLFWLIMKTIATTAIVIVSLVLLGLAIKILHEIVVHGF